MADAHFSKSSFMNMVEVSANCFKKDEMVEAIEGFNQGVTRGFNKGTTEGSIQEVIGGFNKGTTKGSIKESLKALTRESLRIPLK